MAEQRLRCLLLPVLGALLLPFASAGQTLPAGPQVLTFHSAVDDTDQPYAIYLPPGYDETREYPLVVSLHGAGSNHRLNLKRVFGKSNVGDETDVEASRYFQEWTDRDYIVASPHARGTMGYQSVAERDVLDVLADVKSRFSVDEDRVYLTGLSMGGGGTLWIGLTRPDVWAAIAPVCPAPPRGVEALAGNALHLPVRIFQGGADPVVRPEGTRAWVERLRKLGTAVTYDEYAGVQHDSWVQAYADGQIFDWFDLHTRNPFPDRVRFTADQYRYGSAYWVRFDGLTPGTYASIDVSFTAPNELRARTSELHGFTLLLRGHPRHDPVRPLRVVLDGQTMRVPAGADSLSFHRQADRWVFGGSEKLPLVKAAGAEGPMLEVISERHVYVYGTAGDPTPQELTARRQQAERAANWSVYRGPFLGRVMVFPRVIADRQVRPSDIASANLVLFGTRETNSLIERYADRLPVHLDPAAAEYGLVYVYPNQGRYILVSSGLPWWHSPPSQGVQPPASLFAVDIDAMQLAPLGDFLLFEGSPDRAIASGRFDRQWQLPAAAARAMSATGVVTLGGASGVD